MASSSGVVIPASSSPASYLLAIDASDSSCPCARESDVKPLAELDVVELCPEFHQGVLFSGLWQQ